MRIQNCGRVEAQKDKAADGRVAHVGGVGKLLLGQLAHTMQHAPQPHWAQGRRRDHIDDELGDLKKRRTRRGWLGMRTRAMSAKAVYASREMDCVAAYEVLQLARA